MVIMQEMQMIDCHCAENDDELRVDILNHFSFKTMMLDIVEWIKNGKLSHLAEHLESLSVSA
jgi:hypothetical protein